MDRCFNRDSIHWKCVWESNPDFCFRRMIQRLINVFSRLEWSSLTQLWPVLIKRDHALLMFIVARKSEFYKIEIMIQQTISKKLHLVCSKTRAFVMVTRFSPIWIRTKPKFYWMSSQTCLNRILPKISSFDLYVLTTNTTILSIISFSGQVRLCLMFESIRYCRRSTYLSMFGCEVCWTIL